MIIVLFYFLKNTNYLFKHNTHKDIEDPTVNFLKDVLNKLIGIMKKSIKVTSKTDWTKIKDLFGDFRWIKSRLEEDREETEEFWKYVDDFSDYQVDFKDFDIPVSEITEGKFKDITLKGTTVRVESGGPCDFKWVCNNLGSLRFAYDLSENNIKVTIDFKPKFGFAVSTFLKGLFMACPLEELENGVQELVDDFDERMEEGDI